MFLEVGSQVLQQPNNTEPPLHEDYTSMNADALSKYQDGRLSPHECSGFMDWTAQQYRTKATVVARYLRLGEVDAPTILDVGCGCGGMGFHLKQLFPKVHISGIDLVSPMLAVARAALPKDGPFCQADMRQYAMVPDSSMDAVVSISVLQYSEKVRWA